MTRAAPRPARPGRDERRSTPHRERGAASHGERIAPPQGARVLLALLAACVLARAVAPMAGGTALWGLDLARDLPPAAGATAALVALAGFVPGSRDAIARGLAALGRALEARRVAAVLPAIAFAVLALLARDPVRLVGDSTLRLATVPVRGDLARTLPQAGPLDLLLNVALPRALDDATGLDAAGALQAVGAAMVLVWALAAAAFARALGAGPTGTALAWVAIVACGVPVHLAGYSKFGPLLVGLLLAATGAVRLLRDGSSRAGAIALGTGMAIALLGHRTALLAAPAAVLAAALASRPRPGAAAPRAARVALAATVVVTLAALPWALGVFGAYDRERHLGDAGLTTRRALDAVQTLFLLAPIWPVLAWAGARGADARTRAVALAALLPALAVLVTITGSQGALRDWDVHTPAALLVTLVAAAALARAVAANETDWRSAAAAAATVTVSATLLVGWLHVDGAAQLRRMDRQLSDASAWSDEAAARAADFLGTRAYGLEHWDEAVRHWKVAAERAPNSRYLYQVGLSHARAGRLAEARPWIEEAHRRDPANADPFVGFALLAIARNDDRAAGALLDSALARNPRKFDALRMKRMLAEEAGGREAPAGDPAPSGR